MAVHIYTFENGGGPDAPRVDVHEDRARVAHGPLQAQLCLELLLGSASSTCNCPFALSHT